MEIYLLVSHIKDVTPYSVTFFPVVDLVVFQIFI